MSDPYLPLEAEVVAKSMELPDVATLSLRLVDEQARADFRCECGQFNMLYLFGLGEVAISIMDHQDGLLLHTVRDVGRISHQLVNLEPGARVGLRGPYGNGWPLDQAKGKDVVFVTGGLGCAPLVAAIRQVVAHRQDYRRLVIMQGVKHHYDLLWEPQYEAWRRLPRCQVLLAASEEPLVHAHWSQGLVTALFAKAQFAVENCQVMMCGPDPMLRAAIHALERVGVANEDCYLSLERNMQCAIGLCGHCQMGPPFLCRHGPIFRYADIRDWFPLEGY